MTVCVVPENLQVDAPECLAGGTCTFSCPAGLSFGGAFGQGTVSVECADGEWIDALPTEPCSDERGCEDPATACNSRTSICHDNKAPLTGAYCVCKPGFLGIANPGGVRDGSGCQQFSLTTEQDTCSMVMNGPDRPADGSDTLCDFKFRFGGSRMPREISINQLVADLESTQEDLATAKTTFAADLDT